MFCIFVCLALVNHYFLMIKYKNFLKERCFEINKINTKYQISRTKLVNIINLALASYLHNICIKDLKKLPYFYVLYNETLNEYYQVF